MRWGLMLGLVLALSSTPLAGAISASDPTFDEETYAAIFARADVCHDGSIDITETSVGSNETHLIIEQTVRDASGMWTCAGISQAGTEAETVEVQLRPGPHDRGYIVQAWRSSDSLSGSDQHCYRITFGSWSTTECGVGSVKDDTLAWTIPIRGESYALDESQFGNVFGRGIATVDVPQGAFVLSSHDRNELPGFSV